MGVGKYRKVETRIWNDERFRKLSDSGKLLFLFLLTHPYLTSLGAMRATIPGLSAELGWPETHCRETFAELMSESCGRSLVGFDEQASFIGLPNFLKYNSPENPNVVKSWSKSLELLPECSFKNQLIEHARACVQDRARTCATKDGTAAFLSAWETVCQTVSELFRKPVGNGWPNQEPEPEQKPEQEQKPERPASGVCVQVQGKRRESVFNVVTADVLKDSVKLLDWFKRIATRGKRPVVRDSEHDKLNVFAAAERALECGDDAVKLFVYIVGKGAKGGWEKISNEQEERARARLRELSRATTSSGSAFANTVANKLASTEQIELEPQSRDLALKKLSEFKQSAHVQQSATK